MSTQPNTLLIRKRIATGSESRRRAVWEVSIDNTSMFRCLPFSASDGLVHICADSEAPKITESIEVRRVGWTIMWIDEVLANERVEVLRTYPHALPTKPAVFVFNAKQYTDAIGAGNTDAIVAPVGGQIPFLLCNLPFPDPSNVLFTTPELKGVSFGSAIVRAVETAIIGDISEFANRLEVRSLFDLFSHIKSSIECVLPRRVKKANVIQFGIDKSDEDVATWSFGITDKEQFCVEFMSFPIFPAVITSSRIDACVGQFATALGIDAKP
jgi:hypothetical protein